MLSLRYIRRLDDTQTDHDDLPLRHPVPLHSSPSSISHPSPEAKKTEIVLIQLSLPLKDVRNLVHRRVYNLSKLTNNKKNHLKNNNKRIRHKVYRGYLKFEALNWFHAYTVRTKKEFINYSVLLAGSMNPLRLLVDCLIIVLSKLQYCHRRLFGDWFCHGFAPAVAEWGCKWGGYYYKPTHQPTPYPSRSHMKCEKSVINICRGVTLTKNITVEPNECVTSIPKVPYGKSQKVTSGRSMIHP